MLEKGHFKGGLKMHDTVIIAILSLIGTFFGSLSGVITSAKLTNFRLKQLENKVERHNNFAEKIPLLELRIKEIEDNGRP
jgi:hypothetical protein